MGLSSCSYQLMKATYISQVPALGYEFT